jgi:DNA-binding NtrC family response regulator
MERILIIDDNESLRYTLENVLEASGYQTKSIENGIAAMDEINANSYDLVICDMKLPKENGIEVMRKIKKLYPDLPFIILTAFGDIKNAVDAMKNGASDYLTKPFDNDEMVINIRKALELKYLNKELEILRKKTDDSYKGHGIIGSSSQMKDIFEQVKIVSATNLTVLIQGESGTGKEVVANMIHRMSERSAKPFIAVDCGAIPDNLIESELFGHEMGAFTDAKTKREGKFELANSGTIFLDEITNLSDSNQTKLLRTIEERKINRIGSKRPINLDVRILTASNVKLSNAVNGGKFRADLYYRLNEFHINIPPLRERADDIPELVRHFVKEANKELNKSVEDINKNVMKKIMEHKWPGNIRELKNTIRRAVLLTHGNTIERINIMDDIKTTLSRAKTPDGNNGSMSFEDITKNAERDAIIKAIDESGGNRSKAAKILNMNERTFYRKLKSLGIK